MGRRLIIVYDTLHRMFLPPYGGKWDYGVEDQLQQGSFLTENVQDGVFIRHAMSDFFDFEAHGRSPDRFHHWSNNLEHSNLSDSVWVQYSQKPILSAGLCGGEQDMLVEGNCLPKILKQFVECVENTNNQYVYMPEFMLLVPFYYTLFRQPGPSMVKALRGVRRRLGTYQSSLY